MLTRKVLKMADKPKVPPVCPANPFKERREESPINVPYKDDSDD